MKKADRKQQKRKHVEAAIATQNKWIAMSGQAVPTNRRERDRAFTKVRGR